MAAAALTLALVLPFHPHSDHDLADWQEQWNDRIEANGGVLDRNLIYEFTDMRDRHPCQLNQVCVRATVRAASVAAPSSGVYRGMGSDVEQWRSTVALFFAAGDVEWALCIIDAESGGNPDADNPRSSASGLMQHLAKYWPARSAAAGWGGASIWDPTANIAVGAWLYYTGGAGHWTSAWKC